MAVLSIEVPDRTKVFVADGLLNVAPYTPQEYWSSVVTLERYYEQDEPTYVAPNRYIGNKPSRYVYTWPEVLIPDMVAPDRLRIES